METANKLAGLSMEGADYEKTIKEIDNMIHELTEHFDGEGEILQKAGYPDFVSHQELHRKLLAMADDLREAFRRGEIKSWSFFTFLIDEFILDHLKEEDMKFYSWLKKN